MSANVVNQVAFLRTSREFPEDLHMFSQETSKAYIDIANAVNNRVIGIFPVTRAAITGESWFLTKNQKQQTLRQVYSFTTTADIQIGFKISSINRFVTNWGEYTDGTSWFGLINASSAAVGIPGQIIFYVTVDPSPTSKSDLIKFIADPMAPALSSGTIVLTWLSQV